MLPLKGEGELEWSQQGYQSSLKTASSVDWVWNCENIISSVAQSCPTLCNPMDHSTPGLPVHYQLPKSTQTQLHWVGDTIQPSHPLLSPSPPAFNLSQENIMKVKVKSLSCVWPSATPWTAAYQAPPSMGFSKLLLLYWLHQSLWLCGSQQIVEDSSRDGNTRPPYLPPEKSVCRSTVSNS